MRNLVAACIAMSASVLATAGMPLPFENALSIRFERTAIELSGSEQQRIRDFLQRMASRGQCEVMLAQIESRNEKNGSHVRELLRREGIANVRLSIQDDRAADEVRLTLKGNHGPTGCNVH
jgi:type IV pilus biogenesis protein CpaD/CtpE